MPKAFTLLGINPLELFGKFQFLTTVEQAWAEGNGDNGDLPLATLSLPENELVREVEAANAWPKDELRKLILLALRANDLATGRSILALIGAPESIENALWAAFVAVPSSLREACSFDTHFVGCNPVALSYWAVGLPEPPDRPFFVQVDTQQKRVAWQDQTLKQSPYERWVWASLDAHDMRYLAQYKDQSFVLCKWLEGQCVDNLEPQEFDASVVESVFKANQALVRDRVRTKLTEQTSARLADHICKQIHCETKPVQQFRFLRTGFDLALVLQKLYEVYRDKEFAKPIKEEMDSLCSCSQRWSIPVYRLFTLAGHTTMILYEML